MHWSTSTSNRGFACPGRVVDIDPDDVTIGMRVSARIIDLPGGNFRDTGVHPGLGLGGEWVVGGDPSQCVGEVDAVLADFVEQGP